MVQNMSRRKQQNPKSLKYGEGTLSELSTPVDQAPDPAGVQTGTGPPSPALSEGSSSTKQLNSPQQLRIKHEPRSPEQPLDPTTPATEMGPSSGPPLPSTLPVDSLESLLGVPDDAPLKAQKDPNGGYKILSAKYIAKGGGVDPLKAQRIEPHDEEATLKDSKQTVSFMQENITDKVYFLLESSINCGWLKYLGDPTEETKANVSIYYAAGQLWVEVVKNLQEGEQLIAEFHEHNKREQGRPFQDDYGPAKAVSSKILPKAKVNEPPTAAEAQFPCLLCGIQFRNPHTLMAHRKHYCSKLSSTSTSSGSGGEQVVSPGSTAGSETKEGAGDGLQQNAYMCMTCKFMTLTESEMKSHVKEKHKSEHSALPSGAGGPSAGGDKTYCDDCEIHFKKPESYQAHKQHYCKNRAGTHSPRSDNGGRSSHGLLSQSTSPLSPTAKDIRYKKVSVFDNQALSASLATQAAAAMAAASLPFTLSSMLNLPAMSALPMMPLKMFQSPALLAQAMQTVAKASAGSVASGAVSTSAPPREETPLDLSVKQDLIAAESSAKRRASTGQEEPIPSKASRASSQPGSPSPALSLMSRTINGQMKPLKPERPIYRCQSCSIPFYKRDVYEAHRLHYCSRRASSGSEKEEEMATPSRPAASATAADHLHAPAEAADDRLVITYTCNKCSTSYRTIETFKAHQCAVLQASPPLLHCEECSFSTQSSRILVEHSETHRKVNLIYRCKRCGYQGNTLRGMRQHGRQHMLKNEEFNDNDVEAMELPLQSQRLSLPLLVNPVSYGNDVDEELLRLKNEPYKKRKSRKHYQKSEYMTVQFSPERKENGLQRGSSASPHSTSTVSCASPLQMSTMNVSQSDRSPCPSPAITAAVKREPTEAVIDPKITPIRSPEHKPMAPDKSATPAKPHVCSCNASFASISTFEAHKKLYCSHHKALRNNPTITVNH